MTAHVCSMIGEPTLEMEEDEQATIHTAIEHQGPNQQFFVIQTPATYQGRSFQLLIDCGSMHSFLSPKCLRKLQLNQKPAQKMIIGLASGKEEVSRYCVGDLEFDLGGESTHAYFSSY